MTNITTKETTMNIPTPMTTFTFDYAIGHDPITTTLLDGTPFKVHVVRVEVTYDSGSDSYDAKATVSGFRYYKNGNEAPIHYYRYVALDVTRDFVDNAVARVQALQGVTA